MSKPMRQTKLGHLRKVVAGLEIKRLATQVDVLTDCGAFDEARRLSAALKRLKTQLMTTKGTR